MRDDEDSGAGRLVHLGSLTVRTAWFPIFFARAREFVTVTRTCLLVRRRARAEQRPGRRRRDPRRAPRARPGGSDTPDATARRGRTVRWGPRRPRRSRRAPGRTPAAPRRPAQPPGGDTS